MRRTAWLWIVGGLLLGAVAPVMGETTGTVSGLVTNAVSNDPLPDVVVVLESASARKQAKSDAAGHYTVTDLPPGAYHVIVRQNTYLSVRQDVTVTAGPQTIDVPLVPELHFTEVTSVSPEGRSQFETFQATNVLGGQELTKNLQGTLGATLEQEPGIALRSFGSGPARPVIRGLDGDRVLIVQNGLRMGDLSSQSGDHGVNANPAAANTIEVVRGPATLLYGSSAIGGLVNVVTRDVPDAPVKKPTGNLTFDLASAAPGGGAAGDLTIGNGKVALHLGASGRDSHDMKTPDGTLANSYSRSGEAEAGLSYTSEKGYLGASYAWDRSHYGVPLVEEGTTNLDPRRQSVTVRGERRALGGWFDGVKGSFAVRRYQHDERDGDVVATAFTNNTTESNVLAHHRRAGRLTGSVGGSFLTRDFSVAGEEVLSPAVSQTTGAGYVYEEFAASPHVQMQFGGRLEHTGFAPQGGEPSRDFTNASGSVGLLFLPADQATIAFSLASAARNPALEELYFHGPHPGNNAVENGSTSLTSERALGFDASFRWRSSVVNGEVTAFVNQISNFIYRQYTGQVDAESGLQDTFFAQGDARLAGVESHADVRVTPVLWVEGGLDYVRATLTATSTPLPRTPPLRARLGVRVQQQAFQVGAEGVFTASQDRIFQVPAATGFAGETPTAGYGLLRAFAAYSFGTNAMLHTITARLDNGTNARYRNHLNYLKDLTYEMGRNVSVVYNVKF